MKSVYLRWARPIATVAALAVISSCGLPQVGPNKRQIYSGSVQQEGDAFVVSVNDRVTRATAVVPALGFSEAFKNASQLGSDTIRAGDVLGITVYENVDDPLLGVEGSPATILEEVQVDGAGFIFIPYAGRIKAAGNTPDAIRRIITNKLGEQTPDPQVEVRRAAGDGSTVSLIGSIGGQGVYPIERPTRTLGTMLARAGGVTIEPAIAQVTVIRGKQRGKIWFEDLYDHPELDIALRAGDRILVEEDTRSFTALGATGGQAQVPFESQTLSALEGIAQVGGLNAATADPTGVFVFRNEPAEVAAQVLGRNDLTGAQRMVYVLDLTKPNGMFMARDFVIRDGDTLYVTEAPFTQWNKVISAITGTATSAAGLTTLSGG
ncbi:polysaccharide biosynthesis/export family protein [Sulfitobacter geojensis]|uniref:Polysaccharide biosynthesis/export family protein n=1 Tax=Sulfitobacter geojensis TaxID=1342299 RepID=A0AAE2VX36_9RHOB|nr:polysaccharide biosynthesis/export family protein [Sulfitobacter geojensis]MBM1688752.1 polysaccharide biosynthesis/export family protein [Sulfitobacter geojensis]MBM1692819.1 polysaccharide biosynthesis/export family protein [Sulfitobacter geojensis]MBM1704985.1 polysaccharide biosynthesis/export family protein [Sulfitobacter geojensis]MBM1709043.1 polysaccharide biosynthesis/export family protein [Sulfitobacter geojensis]MBM1713108.1 polysaccharide biosynthesis/export family protein [Sulf